MLIHFSQLDKSSPILPTGLHQRKDHLSTSLKHILINILNHFKAAFGNKMQRLGKFISRVKATTKVNVGFYLTDMFPYAKWLPFVTRMRRKLERLH